MQFVTSAEKKDLRKYYLSQRLSVPEKEKSLKDAKIRQIFASHIKHKNLTSICLFHPFRGEPDIWPLAGSLADLTVALPVMLQSEKSEMIFVRVSENTPLTANRYGIMEPPHATDSVIEPSKDTLVVVPALAVDFTGVRLGYGGGYYDRYFGALDPERRPLLAAAIYHSFFVSSLPHEVHDLRVDYVVTESGFFEVSQVKKALIP
jgi:5-formyltetrahydrofolate cyclo-ligase